VKVLVTGGSGFIGSHVVDRLMFHGHEPRVFDLVLDARRAADMADRVTGDILDVASLRAAMRGCDAIVHLAAVADVDEVALDPMRADLVNTRGTAVMLEAAREEGIRRFIYGSTIWVYGNAAGHDPLTEDVPLASPDHFYTATKLAGEMYCRSYGLMFGLAPTILRFGIPHGPGARPTTVVARFVARALAGEPLRINGDGTQARQFVYVEDLADGIVASLTEKAEGRTYNLVGAESMSVREIARIVQERIGDVEIEYAPGRQGDLGSVLISGQRAWEELGWRTQTTFADGVGRYVDSVTATNGAPSDSTRAITIGSAPAVLRQESGAL
jgi:UDP-glucose 4-epimerase